MRDLLKCTLAAAWVLAAADPVPKPLTLGTPVRATAQNGVADAYSIQLTANQFAEVRILQLGQDVLIEVKDPGGTTIATVQSVDGANSEEVALLSAGDKPGTYTVGVAAHPGSRTGHYELKLVALREAAAADRTRFEAQLLRHHAIDEYFEKREEAARKSAVTKLARALELFLGSGDELNALKVLGNWIVLERSAQSPREVVRLADQAIPLARKLGVRGAEAQALFQRGASLLLLGEGRAGLDQAKEALAIFRESKDDFGQAFVLNQLSGLYLLVGDKARAAEYIGETMAISKRLGNNQLYYGALMGKAALLSETGGFQQAIALLEEAKPYYERVTDLSNQASVQSRLGRAYFGLGDKEKARAHYERALQINRTVGHAPTQSAALSALAEQMRELGNLDRAVEMATEAVTLRARAGIGNSHAAVLGQLANLERERGNLRAGLEHVALATRILESEWARLGSAGLRATNLASIYGGFGLHIEMLRLLEDKEPGAAAWIDQSFAISENLRARGWMETLALAKLDLREGVDAGLVAQEAGLRNKLDEKAAEQRRLLAARAPAAELDRAANEFRVLSDQYDEVEGRLRLSSPRLAELTQAQPATVGEVRQMLDQETALLAYFVGSNRSFAWVITADKSPLLVPLGSGEEIGKLAARTYGLLAARNESPAGETAEARTRRLAEADAGLPEALKALNSRILAPSPAIEAALAGRRRWLVVPDGPLNLIPVAALPGAHGHEVVYLPSATALRSIRAQAAGRKPAAKPIAIVADPVFDAADPRVTGKRAAGTATALDLQLARRAIEAFGLTTADGRIPRLLFTRREADAIAAAAPPPARKITDFAASRELALDDELGRHRIIHFATHGLLNSQSPELSGLLLSLVDRNGNPKDGLLQLRDIYSLKLPVELVVMSACQTALGKELRGEGVVGLTRGMLFAGASRVVSSLWKVDDAATAELMRLFYSAMWSGEKLSPAAALRSAQSELKAQARWKAPYYWAGFILQGEYR